MNKKAILLSIVVSSLSLFGMDYDQEIEAALIASQREYEEQKQLEEALALSVLDVQDKKEQTAADETKISACCKKDGGMPCGACNQPICTKCTFALCAKADKDIFGRMQIECPHCGAERNWQFIGFEN